MPESNTVSTRSDERLFNEGFLRRLEALSLVARQARAGHWQGERRSAKRGQSVEFADYRNYVPGDDFRLIDWNAYARLERFFLKLFVQEEDLTIHLLLDTSRSMNWPAEPEEAELNKLDYARRAAAALGYVTLAGLDRVTVAGIGSRRNETFPPHRGRHQAFALFDFLTGLTADGATELRSTLTRYATYARQPGPLVIFSDLLDNGQPDNNGLPGWLGGLTPLLARRFEISVIHLLSPDEVDPPLAGDLRLLDSETGQAVEITADAEAQARYKAGLTAWQKELRDWFARRNISYVFVTTDVPFENLIFTYLRRQGVLR
jgi:uncharacterized protein (DUF58 family)